MIHKGRPQRQWRQTGVVFPIKLQKEQIDHRRWPVGREALQLGREKGDS
jgi:hypothetical protein